MMEMCPKSTDPLTTHVSDATDYSSSSCPPSANSDDFASDGYVIMSFDKRKKAVIKTAVFADVSDTRFIDDSDEDDLPDEFNTHGDWNGIDRTTLLPHSSTWPNKSNSSLRDPGSGFESNDVETKDTNAMCYGEAVWVGEEAGTQLVSKPHSKPLVEANSEWNSISRPNSLIRTSPVSNGTLQTMYNGRLTEYNQQFCSKPNVLDANYTSKVALYPLRMDKKESRESLSMRPRSLRPSYGKYSVFSMNGRASTAQLDGDHSRKMLRCEECGKYYRNEYSLHHHICLKRKDVWKKGDVPTEMVDGQVIYFCPTCSKPFKWLGNLTRHFYVHTGQRFFRCDICSKEFFSAYQVKRHMNSHTGIRFKCEVCDKPFTCKYACAWHTRQH